MKEKIIFLVGPTAVGKTEVSLHLAKKINAEIISCDSMQIYQGMDIITSKPSFAVRRRIPHHLIDLVAANLEFNAARYRLEANRKIKEIILRGKTPLFVGGTGLYMKILIDGIFANKSRNKNIRLRLYRQAKRLGSEYLYERLKVVDSISCSRIHPNDTKRIIRALEVFENTGKPISELQKQRKGIAEIYDIKIFCLNTARQELYRRIEDRVEKMFKRGLVREVNSLLKSRLSKTASCAIGIKEIKGNLEGLCCQDEAKQMMKRNTRLYAKRQLTWFRKDKNIIWIEIYDKEKPEEIAKRIYELL